MSFISVFDVMGPNMIGPSSSHTAGAARIALLARKLLTGSLKKVEFTLYGSFAKTYHVMVRTVLFSAVLWDLPPMTCASAIPSRSRQTTESNILSFRTT